MSGMDRLTDEELRDMVKYTSPETRPGRMARELAELRRASKASTTGSLRQIEANPGDEVEDAVTGTLHTLRRAGSDGKLWGGNGDTLLNPAGPYRLAHRRASQAAPAPLKLLDRADDEAFEWVTKNLCAVRRDNGSMEYGLQAVIRAFQAGKAAPAPSDGLREENERLRAAVLRDAKRRMADLTEWLNADDANPILLRHAVDAADLEFLRAALTPAPTQEEYHLYSVNDGMGTTIGEQRK